MRMVWSTQACAPCHPECRTCSQHGPYACAGDCVHYDEDGRCVPACSPSHYPAAGTADSTGTCLACDTTCSNCTGPTAADCLSCRHYTVFDDFVNRHLPAATVRRSASFRRTVRTTTTLTRLTVLFRDYPGEPVPEK